ncbi:MAG: hypothetical protein DCE86_13385 [Flavobacteriaceae bacterium]|nr:MAG: hypothetical protein DCE86_13385 [Flavobacteriaceae bacterium]PZQ83462.1 MAG: hypothetical protein DI548_10880 [Flavobacterium johnsoniae]
MEITSRRHPYKFYFALLIINLAFLCFSIFFFISNEVNAHALGFIFIGMAAVFNYIFLKKSPKIIVNYKGIQVGKKQYYWNDRLEIEITGKGMGYIHSDYEATKILFKNQDVVCIYDVYYANSPEIKSFINQVVINKSEAFKFEKIRLEKKNLTFENLKTFKGHPIFSFRGIMMWGLILFVIFVPSKNPKSLEFVPILVVSAFCLFWFLLNSWMAHYFQISNKYFIVKNHYFFWIKKVYLLKDIREIVYDQQVRQPNALRIITKDFDNSRFLAGTLRDKHWLEMMTVLRNKKIKVRNESI